MRDSGCVIMKMISSTRSTSIIGVTLMSDCTPPEEVPAMAMLLLLLLVVPEHDRLVGLGDGGHHPHAGAPGGLDRFLHLRILQLVVGLEVENLVLGPGGKGRTQLIFQRAGATSQGPPVKEIPA